MPTQVRSLPPTFYLYDGRIIGGTGNKGKLREIIAVLQGLPYQFRSLEEMQISGNPTENVMDYTSNAYLKASFYAKQSGLITLAEDSGILIDALPR